MNKQQTAVEQLAIALYENGFLQGDGDRIQEIIDIFKEMEKEQHIKSWDSALEALGLDEWEDFEQYYNETYGGKNENHT